MKFTVAFEDYPRHLYIVGTTGAGKTSTIRGIAKGLDLANVSGKFPNAFFYLDPKGDDSFKFLAQSSLNPDRVTFLDPNLTKFAVNPLELPPYGPDERERIVSVYTGFLMRVVQEWYEATPTSAPRMLRIMRSLITYLYHKGDAPTPIDLYDLVIRMQRSDDPTLIEDVAETLSRGEADMLKKEMEAISEMRSEAFDPVLTRLSELATDPFLRRLFSVRRSSVDFRKLLEPGQQTIIRIAGHEVGSHISPLIMSVVVLKIWFSVQERASRVSEKERTPVVLALDEFQDIQHLQAIGQMLTQARSFSLGLVLSHQTSAQLDDKLFKVLLGNVGTMILYRVGPDDATRLARVDPQFGKELLQILSTQADGSCVVRLRAGPGEEQPAPFRVKMDPPPAEVHPWGEVQAFVKEQTLRYGGGEVARPILAQQEKKGEEWKEHSSVLPVPLKEEWKTVLALVDGPLNQMKLAERTGIDRDKLPLDHMKERGQVRIARTGGSGIQYLELTDEGRALLPPRTVDGYAPIATREEAREVALKVVNGCLAKGWFVALGVQSGERKFDLVAFDYGNNVPVAIEIESEEHILHDHPEQVKQHMLEVDPFKAMIVATRKGPAEQKANELRAQLPVDRQKLITVLAFAE